MPRQVNLVVIGISLFDPFAIAAVQVSQQARRATSTRIGDSEGARMGAGHLVVWNSWGEVNAAHLQANAAYIADWYEATNVAVVAPCSLFTAPPPPGVGWWSTDTVEVSVADASRALTGHGRPSHERLIRAAGRLTYSAGKAGWTWSRAVKGPPMVRWSQALAAGAAAWWGREVVRRVGGQGRKAAK